MKTNKQAILRRCRRVLKTRNQALRVALGDDSYYVIWRFSENVVAGPLSLLDVMRFAGGRLAAEADKLDTQAI